MKPIILLCVVHEGQTLPMHSEAAWGMEPIVLLRHPQTDRYQCAREQHGACSQLDTVACRLQTDTRALDSRLGQRPKYLLYQPRGDLNEENDMALCCCGPVL